MHVTDKKNCMSQNEPKEMEGLCTNDQRQQMYEEAITWFKTEVSISIEMINTLTINSSDEELLTSF